MPKIGIHLQGGIKNSNLFRSIPWSDVLILSPDLGLVPQVRELAPQANPLIRFYDGDVMAESPETRAQQFCQLLDQWFGAEGIGAICCNEADLRGEHAGGSPNDLESIAAWFSRYADAHRALRPQDQLHLPACSGEMETLEYWEALSPIHPFYRVLDIHWYALGEQPWVELAEIRGMYGRGACITEWNSLDRSLYVPFLKQMGNTSNCYFLWSSPDPAFRQYEICDDGALLAAIQESLTSEGEMSDNHSVYDLWMKSLGGPGYNPATALGKLREQNRDLGAMIGKEETFTGTAGTFVVQFYATGILWAEKDNWGRFGIARKESELPFR